MTSYIFLKKNNRNPIRTWYMISVIFIFLNYCFKVTLNTLKVLHRTFSFAYCLQILPALLKLPHRKDTIRNVFYLLSAHFPADFLLHFQMDFLKIHFLKLHRCCLPVWHPPAFHLLQHRLYHCYFRCCLYRPAGSCPALKASGSVLALALVLALGSVLVSVPALALALALAPVPVLALVPGSLFPDLPQLLSACVPIR